MMKLRVVSMFFDLILSLITVSLETQKLIKELPEYKEI